MGGKSSRLTIRGSRSSKSSKSQESAPTATEPSVVPRGPYDADLRAHLLGNSLISIRRAQDKQKEIGILDGVCFRRSRPRVANVPVVFYGALSADN